MEHIAPEVSVTPEVGSLARGRLGTWGIVFLVFAAMTPLVGLTSITGLAMSVGSGIGIVGLYIVVGICVLIFQVGYSVMSTEITNAGAFYAYVTRGFGRTAGLAASLLSTLMYQMITVILAPRRPHRALPPCSLLHDRRLGAGRSSRRHPRSTESD